MLPLRGCVNALREAEEDDLVARYPESVKPRSMRACLMCINEVK